MKTLFKIILFLFIIPTIALAKEKGKHTKQKIINKAYIVNADADISVDNSYGNISVTTWNENKIEIDILIKVSGDNEEWVNKRLDGITVALEPLKHLVSAVTNINKSSSGKKGNNNSIEINYNIKIPKNGGVFIKNNYGDILSTDLFAKTDIKCRYGKITLGKLHSDDNRINISYCSKSSIEMLKVGFVSADYSGLTINEFSALNLKSNYTDLRFDSGGNLKYVSSYGKLNVGKINNIEGSGDYLTVAIGDLSGDLKINTKYSKVTIGQATSKAGNISIVSSYTAVGIGYGANYLYDFDIKTKYANFKYDRDLEISSKQENGIAKNYIGYHTKTGNNKISINSDYGNVSLNKNQ
jgi:hypothetical protein